MSNFPTGSVSTGTLRPEDLIPRFAEAVIRLTTFHADAILANKQGLTIVQLEDMRKIAESVQQQCAMPGYYEQSWTGDDLDGLITILDTIAPPDHYFGTHPGDGADYGFWPLEAVEVVPLADRQREEVAQEIINSFHTYGTTFVNWCIARDKFRTLYKVKDVERIVAEYLTELTGS